MAEIVRTELNIITPLVFCLIGLTLAVLVDPYIRGKQHRIMLIIIAMVSALVANQCASFYFEKIHPHYLLQTITSVIAYSLRPAILVVFFHVVDMNGKHVFEWCLVLANTAIHMTAFFSHICFWIEKDNHFYRGPLGYTSHVVSLILLARFVWLSLREYSNIRKGESFVQAFNAFLIILATFLDSFGGEWRFFRFRLFCQRLSFAAYFSIFGSICKKCASMKMI